MRATLILFDVDGTLIDTAGAGKRAMERSFRDVLGVDGFERAAGVPYAGRTDPTILESLARAFEVDDERVRVVARYGEGDPLLSGWALGGELIAGAPAILEADVGAGSVVLFGFQPNYRAQTLGTWPLLFNSIRR